MSTTPSDWRSSSTWIESTRGGSIKVTRPTGVRSMRGGLNLHRRENRRRDVRHCRAATVLPADGITATHEKEEEDRDALHGQLNGEIGDVTLLMQAWLQGLRSPAGCAYDLHDRHAALLLPSTLLPRLTFSQ